MTTTALAGSPPLPQDDAPAKGYGSWVPHDLPYSVDFEDSLITAILDAANSHPGIRVIPEDSDEKPVEGKSVRFRDIDLETLPVLSESDLPIPLSDPRRIYAGPIPGVKLTHPNGWTEGGPSLDPNLDTFADDFLLNHPNVTTVELLRAAVRKEVDANMELMRERLRARQKAKARNEQFAKQIKLLTDQHEFEMRLQQKKQEEKKQKKEARERKRVEKEGRG